MKNLIEIKDDVYFIAERLKDIDKSYQIFFNLIRKCYEVHSCEQKDSYCFAVPYEFLDERTIAYALKTRHENRDKIIKEIEKNNEEVYNRQIKNQVKMIKEAIYVS